MEAPTSEMGLATVGEKLSNLIDVVTVAILYVLAGILFLAILARQWEFLELRAVNALAQLLNVWIVFLILGNLEREERHIKIDMFVDRMGSRARRTMFVAVYGIKAGVVVFIIYSAVVAAGQYSGSRIPVLQIPSSVLHMSAAIGMAILLFVSSVRAYDQVRTWSSPDGN